MMNKKIKYLLAVSILALGVSACSKSSDDKEESKEGTTKTESIEESDEEEKVEKPYLENKYFEIEKGKTLEEVKVIVEKDGIEVNDPGDYDAPKGYKRREVKIFDGENELQLTFRDDQVCSKTFIYDTNNDDSTWFYSNFYDIQDADPQAGEAFGIWIDGVKKIECSDEYEMMIEIYDNIESK